MNIEISPDRKHLTALAHAILCVAVDCTNREGNRREACRLILEDLQNLQDQIEHGLDVIDQAKAHCIIV